MHARTHARTHAHTHHTVGVWTISASRQSSSLVSSTVDDTAMGALSEGGRAPAPMRGAVCPGRLVLGPLDRLEVNTVLHHFPQWTETQTDTLRLHPKPINAVNTGRTQMRPFLSLDLLMTSDHVRSILEYCSVVWAGRPSPTWCGSIECNTSSSFG